MDSETFQSRILGRIPLFFPAWPGGELSPIDSVFKASVPKGAVIYLGEVANQGGLYIGGTVQIVIEWPWEIKGFKILENWPIGKKP